MDKTNVFHRTEEIQMSEEIYEHLQALTYLHEPTQELQNLLTKDIFVKSNPKAFTHVMHFLFNIFDPVMFRKRFYWPLDKATEPLFRTRVVEYLNELNVKYELGLETIQSYIVVIPGGKKFMKVLLEIICLVMTSELKKAGKFPPDQDIERLWENKKKDILLETQIWEESFSEYKTKVENDIKITKVATKIIKDNLNKIYCNSTDLDLLFFEFKTYFENIFKTQIQTIQNREHKLLSFDKKLEELNKVIKRFLSDDEKQFICPDKEKVINLVDELKRKCPENIPSNVIINNKINMTAIFEIIRYLIPFISEQTKIVTNLNLNDIIKDKIEFERLSKIISSFLFEQLSLQGKLRNTMKENESLSSRSSSDSSAPKTPIINHSNIISNFYHTPILKWNIECLDDKINRVLGLSFLKESALVSAIKKKPNRINESIYTNKKTAEKLKRNPKCLQFDNLIELASKWRNDIEATERNNEPEKAVEVFSAGVLTIKSKENHKLGYVIPEIQIDEYEKVNLPSTYLEDANNDAINKFNFTSLDNTKSETLSGSSSNFDLTIIEKIKVEYSDENNQNYPNVQSLSACDDLINTSTINLCDDSF